MKLFVWDFHGTLEKDNELAVLEVTNKVLKNMGFSRQMSHEENAKLYGVKWYKYFEYLLPNEPLEVYLELQKACVEYESANPYIVRSIIKPNDFAHEVLTNIAASLNDQILISNMSQIGLKLFLSAVDMEKFFPIGKKAFATNSHTFQTTKTKREILKKYLVKKDFEKIIVIGDRPQDVGLVEVAGGVAYLYAHPGRDFIEYEANYKIRDLREVLREL